MRMESSEVINFCLREGGDLAGVVKVEDMLQTHPIRSPKTISPEAKSIIVFALKHPDAALDSPNVRLSLNDTLVMYHELSRIGYRLSRFLEKKGFLGITIHPAYPVEMSLETRGFVGDLSLRHAAASAGLGFIGRNKLLSTLEFGPRVRLAAVMTDVDLESHARHIETNCNTCTVCIEKCPAEAISLEGVDVRRCARVVGGPAGLNSMIRFFTELVDKSKEEIKKMIRSPEFWNFHQALQAGISYDCFACMNNCPLGKVTKRRHKDQP